MEQLIGFVGKNVDHEVGDVMELGTVTKVEYDKTTNVTTVTIKETNPCEGCYEDECTNIACANYIA
jgi:metal-sulfur cluster biosynthetic enzyme